MSKVYVWLLVLSVLAWSGVAYATEPIPQGMLNPVSSVGDTVVQEAKDAWLHDLVIPAAGSTSRNGCSYVSKVSLSYACWSPSDNPFGYYYQDLRATRLTSK